MTNGNRIAPQPGPVFGEHQTVMDAQLFSENFRHLHDTSLRAYDDNDFLAARLDTENRILRRSPELSALLDEALVSDDDESILAIAEWANELRDEFTPPNQSAANKLLSYLTFTNAVNAKKIQRFGVDAPNDRANAINILVGNKLCQEIADDQVEEYRIVSYYLSTRLESMGDWRHKMALVKLNNIKAAMTSRHYGITYARKTPATSEEYPSVEQVETESQAISEFFTAMRSSQQYGLKMGYMPHKLGGSLIFSEPHGQNLSHTFANVHPLADSAPSAAEIIHSNKQHFKTIKPDITTIPDSTVSIDYTALHPAALIILGEQGELFVDKAQLFSMRDIFMRQGKYIEYRDLQAGILANYFDLTHSAETVLRAKRIIGESPETPTTQRPMDTINRLLIPRLRAAQGNLTDDSENHREVRLHGVVWHIRHLPEGWSASPEAQQLAAANNITLNPGETFVRTHERGSRSMGKVAAHRLVERKIDSEA